MKLKMAASALALALIVAGCGGESGDSNATANTAAPLPQTPAPNNGDWTEVVSRTPEGGFVMGNPNAPVKLVEYASMTCPHCRDFAAAANERLRNHYVRSGQVSFEFRNFVLNPLDAAVSAVTRCQEPSAFFRLTEQLFEQQPTWSAAVTPEKQAQISQLPENQQLAGYIAAADLGAFFRARGTPEARLNQCLSNQQELQRMAEMATAATNEHRVPGTPGFLINGELVEPTTWAELEPLLRQRIGG